MLDKYLKPKFDVINDLMAVSLHRIKCTANMASLIGFTLGLIACIFLTRSEYNIALLFLILNRLFDGADGGLARINGATDFGGFLDIICDFIIYSLVPFSFAIANPDSALAVSFLLASYMAASNSFLAFAIIAAKRNISTNARGKKSFYYLGGLAEGFETMMVCFFLCLIPEFGSLICWSYGIICFITAISRIFEVKAILD